MPDVSTAEDQYPQPVEHELVGESLAIVTPRRLDSASAAQTLGAGIESALKAGPSTLAIDLSNASLPCAASISVLLTAITAPAGAIEAVIVAAHSNTEELLKLCAIDHLVPFYYDRERALAAVSDHSASDQCSAEAGARP